jgi:hypothetical protein
VSLVNKNFYFGKQANIVVGSANFAALISASPVSFGLSAAQATAFGVVDTALQSAYIAAVTPETRTSVTIQAKDRAIHNMRAQAITLAKLIYGTATVTDSQLVSLGLLPRTVPTPRRVPGAAPVMEFISCNGRVATVGIHGAPPDSSRGKPFGAIGADVYSFVGAEAPTDPTAFHHEGMATRSKFQITFPNTVASGATVWLSAVWVSARGQRSLGSTPISFTLQGGLVPVAA